MTRPANTVLVKLSRTRARALAAWLGNFEPKELTILGSAGMTDAEVEDFYRSQRDQIEQLAALLDGGAIGRPRKPVSTYAIPVAALRVIENTYGEFQVPHRLKPVMKTALRATKKKKGAHLSDEDRERNIGNGNYAPETVRKYRWMQRRKQAFIADDRHSLTVTPATWEGMPKEVRDVLSVMALRRWRL